MRWATRHLLAAGIGGLLLWLLSACADVTGATSSLEEPQYQVAFLRAVPATNEIVPSIVDELRRAGFVPGRNLELLALDANEAYPEREDAKRVVEEWRRRGVDVIFALSTSGALAAREAAPDVNVLFISNDPVGSGLVGNEQQPEGRLTGVTFRVPADRTLNLILRAIPGVRVVGLAHPEGDPAAYSNLVALQAAADGLGIELATEPFAQPEEAGAAVARLAANGAQALVFSTSPTAARASEETRRAAEAHRLPVVANTSVVPWAVFALYPDSEELGRQLGRQAVRLLNGSRPSAVPVEDPRRFLLRVNLAVAEQLGLRVPEQLLREADHVELP